VGKLAAIFIKPSLGVSNWPVIYYTFPRQLGIRSFLSPLLGIEEEAPTSSSSPVTTQDFINFWGKIFVFVLLEMIGFSQGFKTFWVYLKALVENYFKPSIIFLEELL
jgi:hypothetical protein